MNSLEITREVGLSSCDDDFRSKAVRRNKIVWLKAQGKIGSVMKGIGLQVSFAIVQ